MQKITKEISTTNELTPSEIERYSRHLVIPEVGVEGQQKLKAAHVLMIGAGGLGSPLGMYLSAAGVGKIGIVDFDNVSTSNLQRQIIYSAEDIGRLKAELAKKRFNSINPAVEIEIFNLRLTRDNALEIIKNYDIVADGSDNFATRYLVNDACVLLDKPFVYASILRFEGQVSFFNSKTGPCYRCLFPEPPAKGDVPSCEEGGVLGVLPGIIGSIQANEVIKYIIGKGELLTGRLLMLDALKMNFKEIKFEKNPECPVCSKNPSITELINYEEFCNEKRENMTEHSKTEVTAVELKQKMDSGEDFFLLDVREPFETQISSIGGNLIPLGELIDRMNELPVDKSKELIVYCRTDNRSQYAAEFLRQEGFINAKYLIGGIYSWNERIDPNVKKY